MLEKSKKRIAAGASALACGLFSAAPAFAASTGSFESAVNQIRDTANDTILIVGYGILSLLAAIALVIVAINIVGLAIGRPGATREKAIGSAIFVVGVLILAVFLPSIVNGIAGMVGGDVSLGSATRG